MEARTMLEQNMLNSVWYSNTQINHFTMEKVETINILAKCANC